MLSNTVRGQLTSPTGPWNYETALTEDLQLVIDNKSGAISDPAIYCVGLLAPMPHLLVHPHSDTFLFLLFYFFIVRWSPITARLL
jgi:hypothetical protein